MGERDAERAATRAAALMDELGRQDIELDDRMDADDREELRGMTTWAEGLSRGDLIARAEGWMRTAQTSDREVAWLRKALGIENTEQSCALRDRLALAPDPHYACGAAYCDDPACVVHNHDHPNHDD